jgi:hypothetical protein
VDSKLRALILLTPTYAGCSELAAMQQLGDGHSL